MYTLKCTVKRSLFHSVSKKAGLTCNVNTDRKFMLGLLNDLDGRPKKKTMVSLLQGDI